MSDRSSEGVPRNVPADSATPVETRGERFRRKAHRSGLYLYAFLTVALLVCLVALAVANTQLLFSEVSYTYTPVFGHVITGDMNLADKMYMSPRMSAPVYGTTACI